jgi:hypothetical protein
MRLAISVGRVEGDLLVERYKRMVLEELCREDAAEGDDATNPR